MKDQKRTKGNRKETQPRDGTRSGWSRKPRGARINTTGEFTCTRCNGKGHTEKESPETTDHGKVTKDSPEGYIRYTVDTLGSGCMKCLGTGVQKGPNKYFKGSNKGTKEATEDTAPLTYDMEEVDTAEDMDHSGLPAPDPFLSHV